MVANLRGKKVQIHKDDEVRMMTLSTFSLLQNKVIILKNILLWTSFGKEEKAWENKT
jgi:hypothetical protein